MCEWVHHKIHGAFLEMDNGDKYRIRITGCGEGMVILDLKDNIITTINMMLDEYEKMTIDEGLEAACAALKVIRSKPWTRPKENLEALKIQIAQRMEEKHLEGELLVSGF